MSFVRLLGAGFGFIVAVYERVAHQPEDRATHDGLTGCWNRSTTDALLAHELQRAHRAGTPQAVVLLDLDHFKQIHDRHGLRTDDAALRAFADAGRLRLRASDVFGRTGGEKFGLVLPATDAAGASVKVTVSAGVVVADPQSSLSGDRLDGQAGQSLYEAKRAGCNWVEVHGLYAGASAALPLT